MKQIITAKLKLHTNAPQFAALRRTQLAYRDALNSVSQYSFTHGKMSNQRALQRDCYDDIRAAFGLPLYPPCGFSGCQEYHDANVAHSARLDEYGAVVSCP